jgi:hypothetical protein
MTDPSPLTKLLILKPSFPVRLSPPRLAERFMLANDSATIAVEVPVWLGESDTGAFESKIAAADNLCRTARIALHQVEVVGSAAAVLAPVRPRK